MNKLIIFTYALCVAIPVVGMDLTTLINAVGGTVRTVAIPVITEEDNLSFAQKIATAFEHDKKMIKENKLSETNPIHVILNKISSNFVESHNDLATMIKKNSLQYRLNEYAKIDSEPLIQMNLQQIHGCRGGGIQGDIQGLKECLIRNRRSFGQLLLKKKQPNFHIWTLDTRLDCMLDNRSLSKLIF